MEHTRKRSVLYIMRVPGTGGLQTANVMLLLLDLGTRSSTNVKLLLLDFGTARSQDWQPSSKSQVPSFLDSEINHGQSEIRTMTFLVRIGRVMHQKSFDEYGVMLPDRISVHPARRRLFFSSRGGAKEEEETYRPART